MPEKSIAARPRLIALDWGTSSLRAYLLGDDGAVLAARAEPWGILHLPEGGFARALDDLAGAWVRATPGLRAIAAGMIGSTRGWREVPYCTAPVTARELAAGILDLGTPLGLRLSIVPGVTVDEPAPDVMRGEETQVVGALDLHPELGPDGLLVLPGTHSKWVRVETRRITGFRTYLTGELFAVLKNHSILGRPAGAATAPEGEAAAPSWEAFDRGVATARDSDTGALPWLFSTRSLVLKGRLAAADCLDYLSGLLLGEELRCALAAGKPERRLGLIGDAALCARYSRALAAFAMPEPLVVEPASTSGLWRIAVEAGIVAPSGA